MQRLVFQWVFIPWLQTEVDAWVNMYNRSPKRADKNKVLPHGRPDLIFESADMFESYDFRVSFV